GIDRPVEVLDWIATSLPNTLTDKRRRRLYPLIEIEPPETVFIRRHPNRPFGIILDLLKRSENTKRRVRRLPRLAIHQVAIVGRGVDMADNARFAGALRIIQPARKHVAVRCR